jgi:L-aminopeptidase/D-esterase-like protein
LRNTPRVRRGDGIPFPRTGFRSCGYQRRRSRHLTYPGSESELWQICQGNLFCGGCTYGLEAASGVAAGLLRSGITSGNWGRSRSSRGVIVDRERRVVLGNRDASGLRTSVATALNSGKRNPYGFSLSSCSTKSMTLTLVVTKRVLRHTQLQRLAIETHSSRARAVQPLHTWRDGDTLFAVSTANCETDEPPLAEFQSTHLNSPAMPCWTRSHVVSSPNATTDKCQTCHPI